MPAVFAAAISSPLLYLACQELAPAAARQPACSHPHLFVAAFTVFADTKPIVYVGCYKQASGFPFGNYMTGNNILTLERCYSLAYPGGDKMFAVQADGSCFGVTSAELNAAQHLGDAECSTGCPGDASQKCGGQHVTAVYRISGE